MTTALFKKRQSRTRYKIASTAGRPRLSIFRSGKHIYAQVIDDGTAATLASASSNEKEGRAAKTWNLDAASNVGKKIAERAMAKGSQAGGVRPWRLHLSWARQGAGGMRRAKAAWNSKELIVGSL